MDEKFTHFLHISLNFLVDADGSSSSELDVPELEEAIHLGRLADYARRHDRRPRQPLFTAASAAKPSVCVLIHVTDESAAAIVFVHNVSRS